MKHAGIVIVLLLFLGVTAYAEDNIISADEFRLLTPEQQVELLLSEWKDEQFQTGFPRLYWEHHGILRENAEAVKPIVLRYFEEIEVPVQYTTEDRTFEILEYIIFSTLYTWTEDEVLKLAELHREKTDRYLRTYKVVDFTILRFDARVRGFNTEFRPGIYYFLPEITIETLFEKYTGMGYEGLRLPSPEHQVRQYLAETKYSPTINRLHFRKQEQIIVQGGETMKPAILKCFREAKIPRRLAGNDRTYWRLFTLIFEYDAFRGLWTREERIELAELYREKIDWYLRTYKVVDLVIQNFESIIEGLLCEGEMVFPPTSDLYTLANKYRALGYEDIYTSVW
jgi:hypothetical protein